MRLRKLVIATHRDVGYFFAGLTVLYAISGVAVNHMRDWNPNYSVKRQVHQAGVLPGDSDQEIAAAAIQRLGAQEAMLSTVRSSPEELKVFLEQRSLLVRQTTGEIVDERISRRPVLFHLNFLHLNHGKGLWTWYADIYAAAMLLLALTGIFIITGKKGIKGRGLILMIAGLVLPLVFLVIQS
ncbi:MAG: hypothetical protein GY906_33690 [bacterium]|nr:hypothetical protein [bacterium]